MHVLLETVTTYRQSSSRMSLRLPHAFREMHFSTLQMDRAPCRSCDKENRGQRSMITTMHTLHNGPPEQGRNHAGRALFVLLRATLIKLCTFTDILKQITLIEEKCKISTYD
jgi:hypothetical protein